MLKLYLKKYKWKIFWRFFAFIVPLILLVLGITFFYSYLDYFYNLKYYEYKINGVLIVFIFMALWPILVNIFYYFHDMLKFGFNYKGKNRNILVYNEISFWTIILVLILIVLFIAFIITFVFSFPHIIIINRWLSISIFGLFLIVDLLLIESNKLAINEKTSIKEMIFENKLNITLSKESTFLINIPTIVLIFFSSSLAHSILMIDYYKDVLDKKEFLFNVNLLVYSKTNELFINGIETGIIMATIIFSQIVFFVIKTKWEFKLFCNKIL